MIDGRPGLMGLIFLGISLMGCQGTPPATAPSIVLPAASQCPPAKSIPGDTLSGYFRDFNFFTLRGEGAIPPESLEYPYAEVRFRNDSVFVTKWEGPRYPSIFRIRIHGRYGLFYQIRHEPDIKEDSYLVSYISTPDYLIHLFYAGNTLSPHGWKLHNVRIVYPGPVVLEAEPASWNKVGPAKLKMPAPSEVSRLELIRYSNKGNLISKDWETIKGRSFSYHESFTLYEGSDTCRRHSIFWVYFENYITTE